MGAEETVFERIKRERAEKANAEKERESRLFVDGAEFIESIVPPEWLVDGLIQRGYLYGITALTNHGKTSLAALLAVCVAIGKPFAGKECEPGVVLYLSGENPEDFKLRLRGVVQSMGLETDAIRGRVIVMPKSGRLTGFLDKIKTYTSSAPVALVIVDTSAAYFSYSDENFNVEAADHAKDMRELIECNGKPAVISLCHPVKNASEENLLPRGGSGFLNEIDANLTVYKRDDVMTLSYSKLRGPPFMPTQFELVQIVVNGVFDTKGRDVQTVIARHVSEDDAANREDSGAADLMKLLIEITRAVNRRQQSQSNLARACDWYFSDGHPDRSRVDRILKKAIAGKWLERELNMLVLTPKGKKLIHG